MPPAPGSGGVGSALGGTRIPTSDVAKVDLSSIEVAVPGMADRADRLLEQGRGHVRTVMQVLDGVRAGQIDGVTFNNVLTFYGMGGQGKTALSHRLEHWVTGRLPADDEWGRPPRLPLPVLTARWDLHAREGALNIPQLLIALRQGLSRGTRRWKAFDLALAAYLSVVGGGGRTRQARAGVVPEEAPVLAVPFVEGCAGSLRGRRFR